LTNPNPLNPGLTKDYVPLAVSTVGFGILLGTALMTGTILLNRWLVRDLPPVATAIPDVNQPAATVLLVGSLVTLFVPVLLAYYLLAPIGYAYRRFGLAMVSGFAAFLLSLVSVPLNEAFGVPGLAGFFLVVLLGALLMFRSVRRARATA
jgi:ABC-type transport system involved in cytochrome c biogenesis permease subunit